MTLTRIFVAALSLGFGALVVWAFGAASFGESFAAITSDPWGIVSLADLYLGFILAAVLVWILEPSRPLALAVIVPTFFLGNIVPGLWLAARLPMIVSRVSDRQSASSI